MRVDYIEEAADFRIYLGEGLGPSEDIVVVERDEGSIHLEFNQRGQLIAIGVIGQVEKIVPPDFIANFANPS